MLRNFFIVATVLISMITLPAAGAGYEFHVSPRGDDGSAGTTASQAFATIGQSQQAVRQLKQEKGGLDQPVTIYLHDGEYFLEKPLVFTPADNGTEKCPILYTAYKNEKPVIHGGRKITGWKPYINTIWMAEIPEVKSGQWSFRQLYVAGAERRRARFPNEGFYTVAGFPDGLPEEKYDFAIPSRRFEFAPGNFDPAWSNPRDIEVIVYHFWTDAHLKIDGIDPEKRIVTFQYPACKRFTDAHNKDGARYIVENVFEGLDQPGEWYLNTKTGTLYYIPMAGEDMTQIEVVAPLAPGLILLQGDPGTGQFVEHLRFENLAFRYAHWDLPPGEANDRQAAFATPGAIVMQAARQCQFSHCDISNLGTYAFDLREGCRNNIFTANLLHDLAAGGWRITGGDAQSPPLTRTGGNAITDNRLFHYGVGFPSAVGILVMHAFGNSIAHNDIHDGLYTGISVGWEWGYQPSVSRDNIIEFNHIYDIGQGLLSDMGAIYTLGVSPGAIIRNNLIHNVDAHSYGGWGIYNDEGSTHILVENNVVYKTKYSGYTLHYGREITVRNNIFALARIDQLSRVRVEPHISFFFENNIIYWDQGSLLAWNWTDKPFSFFFGNDTRQLDSTFTIDWNLYFNPTLKQDEVRFDKESWTQWQARGKDTHSLYGDPLFVDPINNDFRLRPDSPALTLGFQPIDLTPVGPRAKPGPSN